MQALQHRYTSAPAEWLGDTLAPADFRLDLTEAALAELDAGVAGGAAPPPAPDDRERFAATLACLDEVRRRLFEGAGLVVAGRLPVEEWDEPRRLAAVELLSRLMGPAMAQTVDGTTHYAVRDTGATPAPGVRRSLTNVSQPFHTDGPWVARPAEIVGLYCLEQASDGGESLALSLRRLCRDVAAEAPDLHARLQQDFLWHRQAEHAPGESPVSRHPVLWREADAWQVRLYTDYVRSGYRAAGDTLDSPGARALELVEHFAGDERRWLRFRLAPGEIEWVNNRACAHARTAFEPLSGALRRRLLVRVWHRRDGNVPLEAR